VELTFIGDRCNDHSRSSGYDQICSLFPEAGWLSGRALEAGRMEWHRDPAESGTSVCPIFHVIYGDCSGKALPELLRKRFPKVRILSSTHQPVRRLIEDRPACAALSASDAIVTVSKAQARELNDSGLAIPIYDIPHGVWTRVFRPPSGWSGGPRQDVLLVGSFLRDWNGAKRVVEVLARKGIRSFALGAGSRDHLTGGQHIEVLPRVSEAELAEMYHRSAALFLPFLDATASNALLEAMAAGCPVVCPRLPSLIEYLGSESDCFEAGRYDVAAARILHYVQNSPDRDAKGSVLMARAEQFDWACIKHHYAATYAEVVAEKKLPPDPHRQQQLWGCNGGV
jgi:glycosyltransferase involved in cell wall biosynthesis